VQKHYTPIFDCIDFANTLSSQLVVVLVFVQLDSIFELMQFACVQSFMASTSIFIKCRQNNATNIYIVGAYGHCGLDIHYWMYVARIDTLNITYIYTN
jgi:hypothetical protein